MRIPSNDKERLLPCEMFSQAMLALGQQPGNVHKGFRTVNQSGGARVVADQRQCVSMLAYYQHVLQPAFMAVMAALPAHTPAASAFAAMPTPTLRPVSDVATVSSAPQCDSVTVSSAPPAPFTRVHEDEVYHAAKRRSIHQPPIGSTSKTCPAAPRDLLPGLSLAPLVMSLSLATPTTSAAPSRASTAPPSRSSTPPCEPSSPSATRRQELERAVERAEQQMEKWQTSFRVRRRKVAKAFVKCVIMCAGCQANPSSPGMVLCNTCIKSKMFCSRCGCCDNDGDRCLRCEK